MNNLDSLIKFLSTYNKSAEEVTSAINSFAVDSKFRNASLITKRSTTAGVPAIIVDGKYLTSVKLAGSKENLFNVINLLVEKAAAER